MRRVRQDLLAANSTHALDFSAPPGTGTGNAFCHRTYGHEEKGKDQRGSAAAAGGL